MPQNLTKVNDILKNKYLPALKNQLSTDPSPFLEKIQKRPLTNNKIIGGFPIGINGGFGFSSEGSDSPAAAEQKYGKFELSAVDMYVNIEISDKTIKLASSSDAAMLNVLDREIKGSYEAACWNIGRSLFGDGSGKLGNVTALDAAGTEVTLDSVEFVKEGLVVDFYATAGTVSKAGVRILGVNRTDKKITVDTSFKYVAGFITVQGSYNKEITGLNAIYSSSVTTLYGVTKSSNTWINPLTYSVSNEITDTKLYTGVSDAKNYKNSNIDMILMGDAAWQQYDAYIKSHRTITVESQRFLGGTVGHKVAIGSNEVVVVNEHFVPSTKAWGVDTSSFHFDETGLEFAEYDGSPFVLVNGKSYYRALLDNFGNLMCENPGGCVEWTDCGPSST